MTDDQIAACTGDLITADGLVVAGDRYTMTENGATAAGRTVAYQRLTAAVTATGMRDRPRASGGAARRGRAAPVD